MNSMLKRLFEIQPDETLRKAVYVADEMRDYFGICFVSQLEEKGFSFRFMKNPEKYIDIDIYPRRRNCCLASERRFCMDSYSVCGTGSN
jgi:hypothetical protein